ncbi:TPA: serine hydrolase domain-containing protein [Streptococcus suis]
MRQIILDKISEQIEQGVYPGASLALFSKGQWREYYLGTQDGETPVVAGLTYDLASVSKVVGVGTVLIKLIQSGKVELDKPLQVYYPAFQDASVTIRDLVTHTSGIDPYIPNRDSLDFAGLKEAIQQISVTDDKAFRYTDINLILLGFMLEELYGQDLDKILDQEVFIPWGLTQTSFSPVVEAVPTVKGEEAGMVHDPKAKVLGTHTGSAGLFSTLSDLQVFLEYYLTDDIAADLTVNISSSKSRSIVWNLEEGGWLDHTGYTGPFVLFNLDKQLAAVFLTNRTYYEDDRPLWIERRQDLFAVIKSALEEEGGYR